MRILLTGSTGFLGSALARYWQAQGHELCLLIRPSSPTARIASLIDSVRIARATTAEDGAAHIRAFVPHVVVHTACAYGRRGESPIDILDANLRLGVALLHGALTQESHKTVFLNTGTVLAPNVGLYALSKTQFSQWGLALALQQPHQLQFIDIRLQQMYGPGDDRSKFSTNVIEACRLGEERLALTAGEQQRDFIHIDDVIRAYDTILTRHQALNNSDAIEVGSGSAVTVRQFVELVHRLTSAKTRLDFGAVPYRTNEAMSCVADTARLRHLGWTPQFDLAAGITHTVAALSDEQHG